MKIYVDTCVLMDFLQSERKEHEISLKALIQASQNEHELFISAKSVTDIYYLMRKVLNSNKLTLQLLDNLFDFIDVLDTTKENILSAMRLGMEDFEDAVAVETAISQSMDMIVTNNIRDFKQNLIPAYTAKELLTKIS